MMQLHAMIVGAQKAGTTALLHYFGQVPGVDVHDSLEFPFFAVDAQYDRGFEAASDRAFPDRRGDFAVAKNVGVMFLPWARERLRDHNPECHVIMSVREPVSRAYSAYWYLRKTGQETLPTFEAAIAAEAERLTDFRTNHHFGYAARGRYHEQAIELSELFGRERVHIVSNSDLKSDPTHVLRQLAGEMGIPVPSNFEVTDGKHNQAAASRSRSVARLQHGGNGRIATNVRHALDRFPGAKDVGRRVLNRVNTDSSFEVPTIEPATKLALAQEFATQNELLARDFGVDVSQW